MRFSRKNIASSAVELYIPGRKKMEGKERFYYGICAGL